MLLDISYFHCYIFIYHFNASIAFLNFNLMASLILKPLKLG
jgi:hypothetical protein